MDGFGTNRGYFFLISCYPILVETKNARLSHSGEFVLWSSGCFIVCSPYFYSSWLDRARFIALWHAHFIRGWLAAAKQTTAATAAGWAAAVVAGNPVSLSPRLVHFSSLFILLLFFVFIYLRQA